MAFDWIRISLRGSGGEAPTGRAFFDALGLAEERELSLRPSDSPWQAALVILVEVAMQDVRKASEPSEEFAARVRAGLMKAADRLASVSPAALEQWRAAGRQADIFVGGWLDDQLFDLDLPAEFLLACGRLGLPISICTND